MTFEGELCLLGGMSQRTPPKSALDPTTTPAALAVRLDLAERQAASIADRVAVLAEHLTSFERSDIERRVAAVEARIAQLSLVEQCKAAQDLLRETYAQIEWALRGMTRLRELLGDAALAASADSSDDSVRAALPDTASILAALKGGDSPMAAGLPPELAALLKNLTAAS